MAATSQPAYKLTPLPLFGAEVTGIDLNNEISPATREEIKDGVHRWDLPYGSQGFSTAATRYKHRTRPVVDHLPV